MSVTTNYPTIRITEAQRWAALSEYEKEPVPCPRCDCALIIRVIRPGMTEAMCMCCAARWVVEVVA